MTMRDGSYASKTKNRMNMFYMGLALFLIVILMMYPLNTMAYTSTNNQPFSSHIYDEKVDYKYIKYGLLENRNHDVSNAEVNFTYYTHYSLNMKSKLKNAVFHFAIDESLKEHVLDVQVKTKKNKWISANKLVDGSYAIHHKDVLRTGLIGVNQQFDIKIVLDKSVKNVSNNFYTADIALFDKNNQIVSNTVDSTYFKKTKKDTVYQNNNLITGSGYTVKDSYIGGTEITLNYMMHYKFNAAKHKRGQFKFEFDKKLVPHIQEILIETRDGKFKPIVYNNNGSFSYSTRNLVSHARIGIRQDFSVKFKLKEPVAELPSGIYLFNAHQTTGNAKQILEGTDNHTYFIR